MTLGPRTCSTPPRSIPGTGTSRASIPGSSWPTLPMRVAIGELTEMTGEVSVTP